MNILIRPIVTEKLTKIAEKLNQYGFIVDKRANKIDVKIAIQEMYGVSVKAVNTVRYAGKNKSRYTKAGFISGRTNSFKKAIVTVAEGEKIDFYSNI
jgi:large subunit ribosomal protein L23